MVPVGLRDACAAGNGVRTRQTASSFAVTWMTVRRNVDQAGQEGGRARGPASWKDAEPQGGGGLSDTGLN